MEKELTLKELAAETGVPERTIRYYISRGLLAPPLRGGRGAAYGESHKNALAQIRQLQAKGSRGKEPGGTLRNGIRKEPTGNSRTISRLSMR
jgi:Zn-dependent peptidase ImmA (M78 family)